MPKDKQIKHKPLRQEVRLEYCVDDCSGGYPVPHERKLYPGRWVVRCSGCLHERVIDTLAGLSDDYEHIFYTGIDRPYQKYDRKATGAAALMHQLFKYMALKQIKPKRGDVLLTQWLSEVLDMGKLRPAMVAQRMARRGYIEYYERGAYKWVNPPG